MAEHEDVRAVLTKLINEGNGIRGLKMNYAETRVSEFDRYLQRYVSCVYSLLVQWNLFGEFPNSKFAGRNVQDMPRTVVTKWRIRPRSQPIVPMTCALFGHLRDLSPGVRGVVRWQTLWLWSGKLGLVHAKAAEPVWMLNRIDCDCNHPRLRQSYEREAHPSRLNVTRYSVRSICRTTCILDVAESSTSE